eukprot:TRINITY_DN67204_c6_g9_i1.p1 TRINITY_DN67204_c6_g9~~TRINITY_DN67204_c6_g9_i1.p1  ORF type:complete len:167 (-),score=7.39 TRINITY_DN67204_c6_g9_i1:231-731(-)
MFRSLFGQTNILPPSVIDKIHRLGDPCTELEKELFALLPFFVDVVSTHVEQEIVPCLWDYKNTPDYCSCVNWDCPTLPSNLDLTTPHQLYTIVQNDPKAMMREGFISRASIWEVLLNEQRALSEKCAIEQEIATKEFQRVLQTSSPVVLPTASNPTALVANVSHSF